MLCDATYANTKPFSFCGQRLQCKIVKCYDGDTCWAAFEHNGQLVRCSVRLLGYDSPELKSHDENEKEWAKVAKEHLASMVTDKIITLEAGEFDKFGRILGNIFVGDVHVNQQMIDSGLVQLYDGGTKKKWDFSKFKRP